MIVTILLIVLLSSLLLTVTALRSPSWLQMWAAGILSLAFSILTGFSIGPFVFLLTCLQFAAAIGIKRSAGPYGWLALINLALAGWFAIVPLQLMLDIVVLPWMLAFLLVGLLATLAAVASPMNERQAG